MDCAEIRNDLGAFVVGGLEPPESAEIRRHLKFCPACQEEFRKLREVKRALDVTPQPLEPPPHLKKEILNRIHSESPPVRRSRRWFALSAVAVALVAAGAVLWAILAQQATNTPVAVVKLTPTPHYSSVLNERGYWGVAKFYSSHSGNQRVELKLNNLSNSRSKESYYEMWLVSGKDRLSAGTFETTPGETDVWLNAPAESRDYRTVLIALKPKNEKYSSGGKIVLRGERR